MSPLAIGGLGTPELLIILAVVVLLFGASKLPELARGSGRALRIFKAETKGLSDDDDEDRRPRSSSSSRQRQSAACEAEHDRIARERRDDNHGLTRPRWPFSIGGVVAPSAGAPVHPVGADGRMALSDHLRELRARLIRRCSS